jgi:hypothetical protein
MVQLHIRLVKVDVMVLATVPANSFENLLLKDES